MNIFRGWTFALVTFLACHSAAAVPILRFSPATASVTEGTQFDVDVVVSGLENEFIGTYDLTIGWEADMFAFSGLSFGSMLDGPADSVQGFAAESNALNVFEVSLGLLENQTGSNPLRLFTASFNALGVGGGEFFFSLGVPQILGDELGRDYRDVSFGSADVTVTRAPTSVPEPASLSLMLLGAGGLLFARRRHVCVGGTGSESLMAETSSCHRQQET